MVLVLPSSVLTVLGWAELSSSPASATSKLCGFGQKHFTFLSLDFFTGKRGFYHLMQSSEDKAS